MQRIIQWVLEKLSELLGRAEGSVPGGGWGLLLITLLVGGLIALVVTKLRPTRTVRSLGALFEGQQELTAQQHRELAERAAARGDYADAVRERLRAVVRDLESRGIIDRRPGRTADEVAQGAGTALPELAHALADGARLFDEVWYGGRSADASTYAVLVELDQRVGTTRLVLT